MSDDKTEEATDRKLEDARDKGQVAKSTDLTFAAVLGSAFLFLTAGSGYLLDHLRAMVHAGIGQIGNRDAALWETLKTLGVEAVALAMPLHLITAGAAVSVMAAQVGFKATFEPVMPKMDSLNPANGLKKLMSTKSLIELGKSIAKVAVLGTTLYLSMLKVIPLLGRTPYLEVEGIATIGWTQIMHILSIALLLQIVLGVGDYGLQRWMFMRDQRMSKEDIKKEHKDSEGDPMVKGERRALAQELANSPMKKKVSSSSALLMNPTHLAVALHYDAERGGLPTVVAKGADDAAFAMRRIAEEEGVSVFTNPHLTRRFYTLPIDQSIPEHLFEATAAILRLTNELGRPRPRFDDDWRSTSSQPLRGTPLQ